MHKRILMGVLALGLLLSGCSSKKETSQQVVPIKESGVYQVMEPYKNSVLRHIHSTYRNEADVVYTGEQLLKQATDSFDPDDYLVQEGQLIDQDLYKELVYQRESDDNPNGLNTRKDASVVYNTNGDTMTNPVFVSDLVEFDFYKETNTEQMAAVGLAIVLNPDPLGDRSTLVDNEFLYSNIGNTIALRLESILRSMDDFKDIPIYILLFSQNPSVTTLPGTVLGDALCKDQCTFTKKLQKWIFLPSTEAASEISGVSAQFDIFRTSLQSYVPEQQSGIVGYALIENDEVQKLNLTVNAPTKGYLEVYGVAQKAVNLLSSFGDHPYAIRLNVMTHESVKYSYYIENYQKKSSASMIEVSE